MYGAMIWGGLVEMQSRIARKCIGYVRVGESVSSTIVLDMGMRLEAGSSPLCILFTRLANSPWDRERGDECLLMLLMVLRSTTRREFSVSLICFEFYRNTFYHGKGIKKRTHNIDSCITNF